MSVNGGFRSGSVSTASNESQMAAFDKLPASAREAFRDALFNWATYPVWRRWERGEYKTGKELAKAVRSWDAKQLKREAARRKSK